MDAPLMARCSPHGAVEHVLNHGELNCVPLRERKALERKDLSMPEQREVEDQRADMYRRQMIAHALEQAGILPHAKIDGIARGIAVFPTGRLLDTVELAQWIEGLEITASHLFPSQGQTETASTSDAVDWNALPPMARLTKFREMHPQPPRRRRG
jgi:predicted transcriptional regulator